MTFEGSERKKGNLPFRGLFSCFCVFFIVENLFEAIYYFFNNHFTKIIQQHVLFKNILKPLLKVKKLFLNAKDI